MASKKKDPNKARRNQLMDQFWRTIDDLKQVGVRVDQVRVSNYEVSAKPNPKERRG